MSDETAPGPTTQAPINYHPPQSFEALKSESYEVVNKLLAQFPHEGAAFEKAAQLAGIFGESDLAIQHWRKCIQLSPNYMTARYSLIWLTLQEGQYEQMVAQSREALHKRPDAVVFSNLLGCALIELGKPEEAHQVLKSSLGSAAQQESVWCDTYTLLGKAALLRRDYERAAEYYEQAVEIDPQWSKALYGLGTAAARVGKRERAREALERFRELQSNKVVKTSEEQLAAAQHDVALVYRNAAAVYEHYGDQMSALQLLEWAQRLDPSDRTPAHSEKPGHLRGRVSAAGRG